MICKECGALIQEGANECPNCGATVEMKVPCPNCGALMGINRVICDNCGAGGIYVQNTRKIKSKTKICKYCRSEIASNATVCPICKRGLSWKTNNTVFIVLLLIVVFVLWGIFSNSAPGFIRETVCGLGIRNDYPYCYKVVIK